MTGLPRSRQALRWAPLRLVLMLGLLLGLLGTSVEAIAQTANDRYPIFHVVAVEDEDDWPFLFMEKSFSYENGVPLRLLFRLAKSFSSAFHRGVKCDSQKILSWSSANH
mgnify:CR=1 FL=1